MGSWSIEVWRCVVRVAGLRSRPINLFVGARLLCSLFEIGNSYWSLIEQLRMGEEYDEMSAC